ncbi:MAG: flagellar protein FlgN [Solibacillus sp.]
MTLTDIVLTLGKLEKMHKGLLDLAQKKTEFVKAGDMEELDQIIKQEQAHIATIETLEQQRQVMVTEYLRAKGIALTDTPTVADVIEATVGDAMHQPLILIRARLMNLLEELRRQNDLNQKMIFNSLQMVNITLDAMRPQRPEQFNYSGAEVMGQNTINKKSYYNSQA